MAGTTCGNGEHPDGAWHPSAPVPVGVLATLAYRLRKRVQGCGCKRRGTA